MSFEPNEKLSKRRMNQAFPLPGVVGVSVLSGIFDLYLVASVSRDQCYGKYEVGIEQLTGENEQTVN